jgi:hypothetical protein
MRTIVTTLIGLSLAGAASAQTVDQRHANQQQRIDRGVASGRLTPGEAAHVERQQGRIDRAEARDRTRNGGYLTAANRAHLRARENRASAHIYRAKHNRRGY